MKYFDFLWSLPLFMFFPVLAQAEAPKHTRICDDVVILNHGTIGLSKNEKTLICGVDEFPPYKQVPHYQSKYFLEVFLQERGFHDVVYEIDSKTLYATLNQRTKINSTDYTSKKPIRLDLLKRRFIENYPLTPEKLDEITSYAKSELRNQGYGCPTIDTQGFAGSGHVQLDISPEAKHTFKNIEFDNVEELRDGVLNRYQAFQAGQPYQAYLNALTSERLEIDGIVQGAHIFPDCADSDDLNLRGYVTVGKPRVFRTGVGINTEGVLKLRANLTVHRLDEFGTSFTTDLDASFIKQALLTSFDWYVFGVSRWYLQPSIELIREDRTQYEYVATRAGLRLAANKDNQYGRFEYSIGPRLSLNRSIQPAEQNQRFTSLIAKWSWMSHLYEYYQDQPQDGHYLDLSANLNHESLLSDASAQVFRVRFDKLYNLGGFTPPLSVLGFRFGLNSTLANDSDFQAFELSPEFTHYLGGSENLRGFSIDEIPLSTTSNNGALTTVYGSIENRFVRVLPFDFQPFVFFDVGMAGNESFDLDYPVYTSPGIGLRWPSFIGVFRTTFAHGFLISGSNSETASLEHFQFFFSFGEEF